MKKVLQLRGLDCPNCAAELERKIAEIDGVLGASLAFVNQKLTVEYETEAVLASVVATVNAFEEVRVADSDGVEKKGRKSDWLAIAFSAVALALAVIFERLGSGGFTRVVAYTVYAFAYFCAGYPVLIGTAKNLRDGRIFDENFLMTVASVGAVCIGEYFEAVAVMLLFRLGETLQAIAVDSSRGSVKRLLELKSERASVIRSVDGKTEYKEIPPEEILVGDTVLVKTGERLPVDGVLLGKAAQLDTKPLTGEAELRAFATGEELLSGCINAGSVFQMRAVRKYEESAVGRILDLVENALSKKAKSEKFITKFARVYTPVVCGAALLLALLAPLCNGLVLGQGLRFVNFTRWLRSALTFLVVSCPCALVISVPLTYFSGIGACAKNGILVKGATYLDAIAKAEVFAFDKTGTLTEGKFTVVSVRSAQAGKENELLSLVAAAERSSAHPIAAAFAGVDTDMTATGVTEVSGRGLAGYADGERFFVGKAEWLRENGFSVMPTDSAYTLVHAARGKEYLGVIEVGDRIKAEAKTALRALAGLGISRTVMLTGDRAARAESVASELGVSAFTAELLPDGKLREAEKQKETGTLVYVGDGINDAPVMAIADCAVSMGKLGSAAAVEASDLVLISDDLRGLPRCVKIARKTKRIVAQNIVFSIVMKTAFMALGVMGVLPLSLAVFADVGVMLLAVLNALRVNNRKTDGNI